MSDADARTAIFNATVEMLKLNEKVGNGLPTEIVQCVNGTPSVNVAGMNAQMPQSGGRRRTRRVRRRVRKTQIRRHK